MADTPQPDALASAEPNPFAERLAADPSIGEVGLAERARLNATDAAFRGTISGSADLADFKRALPDQYERITTDLARYEALRRFDGPMEGAAALAGQLFGGMQSPEALITRVPGVNALAERLLGGVAGRIAGAAGAQAVVQGAANPAIQAGEIGSGLRKAYSPSETALAVAGGAVLGGALHGAGEAVGAAVRGARPDAPLPKPKDAEVDAAIQARAAEVRQAETSNMAALAAEDPSLRSGAEEPALISGRTIEAAKINTPGEPVVKTGENSDLVAGGPAQPEAPAMDAPAVVADPEAAAAKAAADVPEAAIAAPDPVSDIPARPMVRATAGKPLSLTQFIARNGGLALDGEAAARDLNRIFIPGGGPLARERGRTVDGFWREALVEHGYLPADADGGAARNIERELFDAIDRERGGDRVYSQQDQAPVASEIDSLHREVEAQSKDVRKALKEVGIGERETDPRTLTDAAELMVRGHESDPLAAYERAAMMRELADDSGALQATYGDEGRSFADEVQFRKARGNGDRTGAAGGGRGEPGREGGPARPGGELPGAGEGGVQFRLREAAGGEPGKPGKPGPPDGVAATADASAQAEPLRSLQQQAQDLADALDVPLRQGRLKGGKTTLGQYDTGQDVARVRNVADFETVAHEAGHALEKRVGRPLSDLVQRFAAELGSLDYDPQAARPSEGFAEWMRMGMMNPAMGERQAPGFSAAFRALMERQAPDLLAGIDAAAASHQAYLAAPSGAKLEAMVRKPEDEGVIASIKRDGVPQTIRTYLTKAYEGIFDDKAPVTRAVRDMARAMKAQTGERVKLQGADNPENLVRLFARAQQAAVQDMREGVRPYRGTIPEGPSLSDALATATGKPSLLGRWDEEAVSTFDRYLVARRAEVLYHRFEAGEMERRPIALSPDEVRASIADLEAANPGFRAGADQIHGFTRQLLRKQYEGGLIDADLYGRLMDEEFYVPLYRHMDDKPNAGSGAGGSDGPGTVDTVKRLKGSDRDVIPPTQSLMTQAFLVNRTLQHNDIIKSFVGLARQAREVGARGIGRIVEEIPPTQMVGKTFDISESVAAAARRAGTNETDLAVLNGALTDVFGEDPIMGSIFRAEPTGKRGEPIVFYKDGGQLRAVRMISAEEGMGLYEAVAGLPPIAKDWALNFAMATSQLTRAGITSDPTFVVSNFVRDQVGVAIIRPDYIPFVSGMRGIASELRQDQWASMYAYGGGVSPGAGAAGLSELIERDVNALARKGWLVQKLGGLGDLRDGNLKAGFTALSEVAATSESSTRLSVFKRVYEQKIKQGLSQYDSMIEAAAQSTDLMDFGRHGSKTGMLRSLVPFINAHAQGLDKGRRTMIEPLWRAARGDIVTTADATALRNAAPSLIKMAAVGGGLGYAYGQIMAQYDAYHDASPELRASHLIVPGAAFGFSPNSTLVIPKPFELAMGFNLGELVGLHNATGDPRTAGWAMTGLYDVLAPPNPLESIPVVKTYAELKANRSFFTGKDIVKENEQNKEHPGLEFNDRTSAVSKAVGRAIDVSPIKIDYAVGSMFGTLGRNLISATTIADLDAPDAASDNTMFLKRFIKGADQTSETTKLFWEQSAQRNGTYAQARNRFDGMIKDGKDRDAIDYLGSLPAAQRAFVTLAAGGDEGGRKAVFSADDRRLHPITRGAAAVQVVGNLIKDLTANRQESFESGEKIPMTPTQRRDVIDGLRVLQAMEMRNALVIAGEKGYAGRPLLSTEDQFAVLKAQSPVAAAELATRYATNKILPTAMVADFWPEAQKALLADGSQADIRDMSLTAKSDGWAFGGDAVRRPQKRRIGIVPGERPAAPPPVGPEAYPKNVAVPNPFE